MNIIPDPGSPNSPPTRVRPISGTGSGIYSAERWYIPPPDPLISRLPRRGFARSAERDPEFIRRSGGIFRPRIPDQRNGDPVIGGGGIW